MNELKAILQRIISSDESVGALATLVTVSGSSYRRPGARLLLTNEGARIGSISGGCLEEDVLARAQRVAKSGTQELVTYDTTSENDLIWGVGLGCHGVVQVLLEKLPPSPNWAHVLSRHLTARQPTEVAVVWGEENASLLGTHTVDELPVARLRETASIFIETIQAPITLAIFGAGDDARPLVRLAKELGWHVTVGDPRADVATTARFPGADAIVVGSSSDLAECVYGPTANAITQNSCAVIMTHHYVHDLPLLRDLSRRALQYIGLLGPKKRAERIVSDLEKEGVTFSAAQRKILHAPVGLDIGAETPEEVALSIVAEIRATLAGRDGSPLRERDRPIHE